MLGSWQNPTQLIILNILSYRELKSDVIFIFVKICLNNSVIATLYHSESIHVTNDICQLSQYATDISCKYITYGVCSSIRVLVTHTVHTMGDNLTLREEKNTNEEKMMRRKITNEEKPQMKKKKYEEKSEMMKK